MNTIDNNEFMILNSIIYKIHTNPDFAAMRKELLEQLKMIIDLTVRNFIFPEGMAAFHWIPVFLTIAMRPWIIPKPMNTLTIVREYWEQEAAWLPGNRLDAG